MRGEAHDKRMLSFLQMCSCEGGMPSTLDCPGGVGLRCGGELTFDDIPVFLEVAPPNACVRWRPQGGLGRAGGASNVDSGNVDSVRSRLAFPYIGSSAGGLRERRPASTDGVTYTIPADLTSISRGTHILRTVGRGGLSFSHTPSPFSHHPSRRRPRRRTVDVHYNYVPSDMVSGLSRSGSPWQQSGALDFVSAPSSPRSPAVFRQGNVPVRSYVGRSTRQSFNDVPDVLASSSISLSTTCSTGPGGGSASSDQEEVD